MAAILNQEFLNLLNTIVIKYNLTLKDGSLGGNRSKAKGSSVEFSDFREYIEGDDFRRIDWKALARFEKVYIKLFMEEREAPIYIFIDKSKSMDFGGKKETAIKLAATYAFTSLREYNSVSAIMFDKEANKFELNQKGGQAFAKIINLLESTEFASESDLYQVIYNFQPKLRKGVTIIISDLMYDTKIEETLKLLQYKKQKTILIHTLSKEEITPDLEGNLRLKDSETGKYLDIHTGIDSINLYRETLIKYINKTKETCSKYKTEYLLVDSSKPIEEILKELTK